MVMFQNIPRFLYRRMSSSRFQKIPYCIKPIHYNIEYVPNPHTFKFTGSQSIECQINERVETIKLNVKDLEVWDVTCNSQTAQVSYDEPNEIVIFKFPSPLEVGPALLNMKFRGLHNDLMKGFYRSSYTNANGETIINLTTQFEASDARRAFPCIDEPDRKAQFSIAMIVPSEKVALSNMPEISRIPADKPADFPEIQNVNYVRVSFDKTPIMSTYLLAMVIGDFEYIEDKDENGVIIRVYAPPGKIHCCDYPMNVAKKALPFYNNCFGVEYPLPKLDLIAIPDFAAGAMENWGLVTYRETALLIDPEESSVALKRRVALVVAHELAHMWFGNLVTMKWWTHLWLNEGFATWMEYLCVDHVLPEFDIWTTFTISEQSTALSLDGLKTSHPIEVEVGPPSEVDEIFDSISYAKGASVINMLYNWIGHESFFRGLKTYIAKHKYSNTQTEDLWNALGEASGQNVCNLMSEWTKKMGYPVVIVSLDAEKKSLVFSQQRFLGDGSEDTESYKWPIPLKIAFGTNKIDHVLNPSDTNTLRVPIPNDSCDYVLVNPGRSSFVRILYDTEMMPRVKKMLESKSLLPVDRLAILDDHLSLAFAGKIPISQVIDLMTGYAGESHHIVWDSLSYGISHIRLLLEEAGADHNLDSQSLISATNGLHRLVQILAEPVFKDLGWDPVDNESYNETLLRSQIISLLGHSRHEAVITEAKRRFEAHFNHVNSGDSGLQIKSDIRGAVYAINMRNGGTEVFERLIKLYEATNMSDERVRLLSCLGISNEPRLRSKAIKFALSEKVRKQDRYCCLISLNGAGPDGRRDAWNFVQENICSLPEALGSQALLAHVLKNSCRGFAHAKRHEEVSKFWDANPVPCQRAVKQAVEEIGINASQLSRDCDDLVSKLCSLEI